MANEFSVKDLCALTEGQLAALRKLRVSEHQEVLGKSFLESVADWDNAPEGEVLGLCFLLDVQPIGMTLFRRQNALKSRTVSVHGLKIAIPWQRRGYGHQAFLQAVAHMKSVWPDAETLKLAVDAKNTPALAIYRRFGMSDSGPAFDGPNGKEHHMEKSLRS